MSNLNREELAKFFADFDELTGDKIAYIVRNFDPSVECYHLNVQVQQRLYVMETRYEPAEYEQMITCKDCGEELDSIPKVADYDVETVR
jgi:hypothetical protein